MTASCVLCHKPLPTDRGFCPRCGTPAGDAVLLRRKGVLVTDNRVVLGRTAVYTRDIRSVVIETRQNNGPADALGPFAFGCFLMLGAATLWGSIPWLGPMLILAGVGLVLSGTLAGLMHRTRYCLVVGTAAGERLELVADQRPDLSPVSAAIVGAMKELKGAGRARASTAEPHPKP
jgi:hypothetical protein